MESQFGRVVERVVNLLYLQIVTTKADRKNARKTSE